MQYKLMIPNDFKHNMDYHKKGSIFLNNKIVMFFACGVLFFIGIVLTFFSIGKIVIKLKDKELSTTYVVLFFIGAILVYTSVISLIRGLGRNLTIAPLELPKTGTNFIVIRSEPIFWKSFLLMIAILSIPFVPLFIYAENTSNAAMFGFIIIFFGRASVRFPKSFTVITPQSIIINYGSKLPEQTITWNQITSITKTRSILIRTNEQGFISPISGNLSDPCWLVYSMNKLNDMRTDEERNAWLSTLATNQKVSLPNV